MLRSLPIPGACLEPLSSKRFADLFWASLVAPGERQGAGNLESTTKEKIGGFYTIGACLCEGTCVAGSYSAMAIRFGNSSTMVTFTAFGVPFEVDKRYELVRQLGQARYDL